MNINYIILAHKNPLQLERLIKKLTDRDHHFYVHIDKCIQIEPFLEATSHLENVYFISDEKRENGLWGDIGIVRATINALMKIVSDKRRGYCILLSGQDYPIKNKAFIESFLDKHNGVEFIEHYPIPPGLNWLNDGLDRINSYKFNISIRCDLMCPSIFDLEFYSIETFKKIIRLARAGKYGAYLKLFKKRRFPSYIKPYGGSQWWAITIETVKKILNFIQKHPDYLSYHKYTLLPDEIFFQSIIMHLNKDKPHLIQESLTYLDWGKKNVTLPVTFTLQDIERLNNQPDNKLFARKFDIEIDSNILNVLDSL